MGGWGSIYSWFKKGLTLKDKLHFTEQGYSLQANLFTLSLLEAYNSINFNDTININQIYSDILNIDGVVRVYLKHTSTGAEFDGLSLIAWNPIYPTNDITITSQNIALPYFKYAYLNNLDQIINKIKVINTPSSLQNISI